MGGEVMPTTTPTTLTYFERLADWLRSLLRRFKR
jgi:hypothetical protein